MSVTTKYIHEAHIVEVGRVTITSSRLLAKYKTKLVLLSSSIIVHIELALVLSLSHLSVVSIETLISVLNYEGVTHRNRSGRGKTLIVVGFLLLSMGCTTLSSRILELLCRGLPG